MRGKTPEPFYTNLWCSLAEEGWVSTGTNSYGLIRWQRFVETGHKHKEPFTGSFLLTFPCGNATILEVTEGTT